MVAGVKSQGNDHCNRTDFGQTGSDVTAHVAKVRGSQSGDKSKKKTAERQSGSTRSESSKQAQPLTSGDTRDKHVACGLGIFQHQSEDRDSKL